MIEPRRSRGRRNCRGAGGMTRRMRGVTLVELLMVVGTMATLAALLVPALSSARGQVKSLRCMSNLRSVVFEFRLFAEDNSAGGRGESDSLGRRRFKIDDFQEKLYGIDEFWDQGTQRSATLRGNDAVMICPAGSSRLVKRRDFPCGHQSLGPVEDVSLAMNMRLRRGAVRIGANFVLAPVAACSVRADIIDHPSVPLVFDVDGESAKRSGIEPFYIAPAIQGKTDPYRSDRFWAPSKRHQGLTQVGFSGGHVLSSSQPESEPWDWGYQAEVGR